MLDPGRYLAEAIYFLQYTLAQLLWAVDRALLSMAVIAESINRWLTDNVGYFVELMVNALSAPLGGLFILALTALGFWYVLNNILPTNRWVDPSKLFSYGLIAFFFFSSPIVVIDVMESLRQTLNAGIDQALLDGAAGEMFVTNMNGTDPGLPAAIPDVNSDGVLGSFDLVAAFMRVANLDELDSSEFPVDFEADYFPFGDPAGIDLSDEADQELAKALASDGIERLLFALVAIPTAIAEHGLRLVLTGVAMFLYLGVPLAMLLAFFVYTQALLGAYLRQFMHLFIETFVSVLITALVVGLLAAAAQQGIGLFLAASLLALFVLVWRIKSALRLAATAFDLFGGGMLTGGAGGLAMVKMGQQAAVGTVALAGAALTGGATVAAGGAVLAGAAALQADNRAGGAYLGTDPDKTDGRVRQLQTMAGYALGHSDTARAVLDRVHETRTLSRNFRDGAAEMHDPDTLDFLRAGSSMSGFSTSPWLAMRFSAPLRAAYDTLGGPLPAGGGVAGGSRGSQDSPREPWESWEPREARAPWESRESRESGGGGRNGRRPALPPLVYVDDAFDAGGELVSPAGEEPAGRWRPARTALPALPQQLARLEEVLVGLAAILAPAGGAAASPSGGGGSPAPANGAEAAVGSPAGSPAGSPNGSLAGSPVVDRQPVAIPLNDPAGEPAPPDPAGAIRLAAGEAARQQSLHDLLAALPETAQPAGQAAYQALALFGGPANAGQLQAAVAAHTPPPVQQAAAATAALAAGYRAQGLDDAAILRAFQEGQATATLRAESATPLSDAQLAAVADLVLLPQRQLTRTELVMAIGQQAAAGATSEQAVIEALAMPTDFGRQTGNVRGVLAGVQALSLSPADLAQLASLIRDGLWPAAQTALLDRGGAPDVVHAFISDVATLPHTLVVPQTSAGRPRPAATQEEI